jgi:hypothetical protein
MALLTPAAVVCGTASPSCTLRCALLCNCSSTTSAQARRGRPRCALTQIEPVCRAIVAAQRACTPRSAWGRSRSSRTVSAHAAPLLGERRAVALQPRLRCSLGAPALLGRSLALGRPGLPGHRALCLRRPAVCGDDWPPGEASPDVDRWRFQRPQAPRDGHVEHGRTRRARCRAAPRLPRHCGQAGTGPGRCLCGCWRRLPGCRRTLPDSTPGVV